MPNPLDYHRPPTTEVELRGGLLGVAIACAWGPIAALGLMFFVWLIFWNSDSMFLGMWAMFTLWVCALGSILFLVGLISLISHISMNWTYLCVNPNRLSEWWTIGLTALTLLCQIPVALILIAMT